MRFLFFPEYRRKLENSMAVGKPERPAHLTSSKWVSLLCSVYPVWDDTEPNAWGEEDWLGISRRMCCVNSIVNIILQSAGGTKNWSSHHLPHHVMELSQSESSPVPDQPIGGRQQQTIPGDLSVGRENIWITALQGNITNVIIEKYQCFYNNLLWDKTIIGFIWNILRKALWCFSKIFFVGKSTLWEM